MGGAPRRMASLSLWLPDNVPQGRVSSASAHAGPARRTASPFDLASSMPSLLSRRSSSSHSVGAVAHVSDLLDPTGNRDAPC